MNWHRLLWLLLIILNTAPTAVEAIKEKDAVKMLNSAMIVFLAAALCFII